jgi:hypothetical protein
MDKDMRTKGAWGKLILGIWVLISPWVVPANLKISNVIVGILIILMACLVMMKKDKIMMPPKI